MPMWLRRRRLHGAWVDLPRKVFISFSYSDVSAKDRVLAQLPNSVEPLVFPPIVAQPSEMVSDKLLDAIRACDGLIYLTGGASAQSFWVALERDYALRTGKAVFAFDPLTTQLRRDTSKALSLPVFPSYAHVDQDMCARVLTVLHDRSFELGWYEQRESDQPLLNYSTGVQNELISVIKKGGYILAFWSQTAANSKYVRIELEAAVGYQLQLITNLRTSDGPQSMVVDQRILFAMPDDTPLPTDGDIKSYMDLLRQYQRTHNVMLATDPVRLTSVHGVLDLHRVDDLIVHLYWLIYRNTRQNELT